MFRKSLVVTVTGLSLVGLLSGCAGSDGDSLKKQSPSPTQTPIESETPIETPNPEVTEEEYQEAFPRMDYDAEILLAKNELEHEFLTIALNSCKKAQDDGFVVDSTQGQSLFRSAERGIFPEWPFEQVSIRDGKTGYGSNVIYYNYPPSLFDPCSLERQARFANVEPVGIEHKVTKLASNSYAWFQHHGGASLEKTVYQVKDGLISAYGPDDKVATTVTYGPLTAEQNALLDQN